MIRRYFLLIISCLLTSNSVYGATEVKPPEGPFISQLRATFSIDRGNGLNEKNAVIKEKKYNFQVPDLGRYQERSPATVMINKPEVNASVFNQGQAVGIADRPFKPEFDSSAFDYSASQNNQTQNSPFSVPFQNQRQQSSEKMSFDAMPINENTESHLISSYPSEWSQLNPLNIVQESQGQGAMKNQFNEFSIQNKSHQNAYPIAQPFSNPRVNEPMNNNSNYGYK